MNDVRITNAEERAEKKLEKFVNTFINELHRRWLECSDAATTPSQIFEHVQSCAEAARQEADI